MDAVIQNINVGIPKSEMKLFRALAKKMGWEIHTPESVLDAYIASRPKDVDLSEDDILEEIAKVRYNHECHY
jgi:hypothetical protein